MKLLLPHSDIGAVGSDAMTAEQVARSRGNFSIADHIAAYVLAQCEWAALDRASRMAVKARPTRL